VNLKSAATYRIKCVATQSCEIFHTFLIYSDKGPIIYLHHVHIVKTRATLSFAKTIP